MFSVQTRNNEKLNLKRWLNINLFAIVLGLSIGVLNIILMSLFQGKAASIKTCIFQVIFSLVIGIFVSNGILLSKKLWSRKGNITFNIALYYLFSLCSVFLAIEVVYLLISGIFNTKYTFFHTVDFLFSSVVTIIVCTIIYAYDAQKIRLNNQIKQKELDLLKFQQMNTKAELAALQSKINPHFLYNSLNAIASLIHLNPDEAEAMTLKLSKFFRYSINQSQNSLITVTEEIEILNTYLEIEKIRFGNRINFKIEIDDEILNEKIPRFLIQPLVENALKHGLKNTASNGELYVSIRKKEMLEIIVADNGISFPEELEIGYGLQSTYDKLSLLFGRQYEVQILNSPIKQIIIQLPYTHG